MDVKWEVWGVVGVIALQSIFIWLVYYMAADICRIYFMTLP